AELTRQIDAQSSTDICLESRLKSIEAAIARFPDDPQLRTRLAQARRESEEIQDRILQARSAATDGRFEEARAFLETIEVLDPKNESLTAERQHSLQLQENAKLTRRKARILADIREAMGQRDFERSRSLIDLALSEYIDDIDLKTMQ